MKMSPEKSKTKPIHFFFLGGGGKGVKEVYYGICAGREFIKCCQLKIVLEVLV